MRNFLLKLLDYLITFFTFCKNSLSYVSENSLQEEEKEGKQFTLTPSLIEEKDEKGNENKFYKPVKDIAAKLRDPEVRNIALTGSYGAGKSSIIKTLERDFPEHHYLHVSLATLETDKENSHDDQKILSRLIEYSIVQQIIYKEKIRSIPQSRFKRIKHISKKRSTVFAIEIVFFILGILIVFEPDFLIVPDIYEFFSWGKGWNLFFDLLFSVYILLVLVFIIRSVIILTYNSKLNIKGGEIDIGEDTSIFNKHLDEILYFFEVTDYNVVVIEDLERFDMPCVFLKLKELNQLINGAKCISGKRHGPIVFLYAVKDDLFKDTCRTKFFDYITTVIPVINPSNSCDKLLEAFKKFHISDITENDCRDLGIFIDDMRLLKNIVNEYIQYRERLSEKLIAKKLLAMILYKNYFPEDFAELPNRRGIVYTVLQHKEKYKKLIVTQLKEKIQHLKEQIKVIRIQGIDNEEELRVLYVERYKVNYPELKYFLLQGEKKYTPTEVVKDKFLFDRLRENEFTRYTSSSSNIIGNKIRHTFETIEKEIDETCTYEQKLQMCKDHLFCYEKEVDELNKEVEKVRSLSLSGVLTYKEAQPEFFKDVKDKVLITYLLQQGYIDEDYYDYISFFYSGTMTVSDRDYILDLKIGKKKEFSYPLVKYKPVLEQIPDFAYENGTVLNVGLVDYLALHRDRYSEQWGKVLKVVRGGDHWDFGREYYRIGTQQSIFFSQLFEGYSYMEILGERKKNFQEDWFLEIFIKYFPKTHIVLYKGDWFRDIINQKYALLCRKTDSIGLESIRYVTKELNVKYENIDLGNSPEELRKFILEGNYYDLHYESIKHICLFAQKSQDPEGFEKASYTTVLSTNYPDFIAYVKKKLEFCMLNVFPDTSKEEKEEALRDIVTQAGIKIAVKKKYLDGQRYKILELRDLGRFEAIAIQMNLIAPLWKNVNLYFQNRNFEVDDDLKAFIQANSNELSMQPVRKDLTEKQIRTLSRELIESDVLSLDSYPLICKAFRGAFFLTGSTKLDEVRIKYSIESDSLVFNKTNFKILMEQDTPEFYRLFLIRNIESYLKDQAFYTLSTEDAVYLLASVDLSIEEKKTLISFWDEKILTEEPRLPQLICEVLGKGFPSKVNEKLVIKSIKFCKNELLILKIANEYFRYASQRVKVIYDMLLALGGKRTEGCLKELALTVPGTWANRLLLKDWQKRKFISLDKEKEGSIRIIIHGESLEKKES